MPTQAHPRVRKRLPCAVQIDDGRHRGLTLNLSRGGLFVQTDAGPGVGARIGLELSSPRGEAIPVDASVVWRKVVPRSLRGVSHSGLGVCIHSATPDYESLVSTLLSEGAGAAQSRDAGCAAWRVRLRLAGTPRSRTVVVVSDSEEEAARAALAQQDSGWSVLDLARMT